jgi:hypothetical protein
MGLFERVMDALFENVEIRDGCGADDPSPDKAVFLKRWFIIRAEGASTPPRKRPLLNLTRVRKDGGMVLLHKFVRSDADRELHDHPWSFTSLILWRGYFEEVEDMVKLWSSEKNDWIEVPGCEVDLTSLTGLMPFELSHRERRWPLTVLRRKATHRHRVHLIDEKPSWSLVFTEAKNRSWGFWRNGIFIPWREFISKRCEQKEIA